MQITKELTVFKFNDQIIRRIPGTNGKILYCVNDICAAMGVVNVADVIKRLQSKEIDNIYDPGAKEIDNIYDLCNSDTDNNDVAIGGITWIVSQTSGGVQKMAYTDEVGLYDIISKSRKPLAKVLYRKLIEAVPAMRESTGRSTPEIASTDQVILDTHNIVKVFAYKVDARFNRLEQMVSVIQSNQQQEVKLLKAGTLPAVSNIDWRSRLNKYIRNISRKFNWPESDCWNMVYYEDKYRNHRDIKAIARNRGCRSIQVAQENGWLQDLCAIAKAILSGEIVSVFKLNLE